jgi:transcriptional regulator with GAF, ATPase, and Fis domain
MLCEHGRPVAQMVRIVGLRTTHPDGGEERREFAQTVVRVGGKPGNDLVLRDETVSRFHFEIALDEHGFRLRDLGSTNGTLVDGWRAADLYLRPGAEIRIGQSKVVFEPSEERAELPLSEDERFGALVGRSAAMRELFATLGRIAPTSFTVLIEGETGTGKEGVADAIHQASPRSKAPFVVFDCAAVSGNLLESEFFGHERGAFTGAETTRSGCMEEAHRGTLFLDEIGELPLDLQPKLLRALERREFRRVGGTRVHTVDVRVVAATNRDLAREVNQGTFRDDLYYRLGVVRVRIPPLRERPEDVRLLAEHFLRTSLTDDPALAERVLATVPAGDWERLERYPWPGNARELRNVVDRALALGTDASPLRFDPAAAGPGVPRGPVRPTTPAPPVDLDRPMLPQRAELVVAFEKAYLTGVLERHDGKYSRAASAAGIDRMYFKRLLRRHGY